MAQKHIWEREYRKPKLISGTEEANVVVKHFAKFLKRKASLALEDLKVLDLGSGTGKNALYFAERGSDVTGMEIAPSAIHTARTRAETARLTITYLTHDIGTPYPLSDGTFDVALDVMSSNSLLKKERDIYLSETSRVLKDKGYFLVRILALESDLHAKNLLQSSPGPEENTYVMPKLGLIEHVFSRKEFCDTYEKYFDILSLERVSAYTKFEGRSYKRNYWVAYLQKRSRTTHE